MFYDLTATHNEGQRDTDSILLLIECQITSPKPFLLLWREGKLRTKNSPMTDFFIAI